MFGGVERRGGGHFEGAAAENRGEFFLRRPLKMPPPPH